MLARDRPVIAIEVLPRAQFDVIGSAFADLDYRLLTLHPGFDIREAHELTFHLDAWNQLLVPAEDLDRVRAVLAHAADQLAAFLAVVGEPMDPVALEQEAAALPSAILAEQFHVEVRASAAEARDSASDLARRVAALDASLAHCRQRAQGLQEALELAQSQASPVRKAARRVKRRLRPTSPAPGRR